MNRIILTSMLFLCLGLTARAGDNLFFRRLSTADGLPSAVTNDIVQDTYGFIWIATSNGLSRYDGRKLLPFPGRSADVFDNGVNCLFSCGDSLLAGTTSGLFSIDLVTHTVRQVNTDGNNNIRVIARESDRLWVGTHTGVVNISATGTSHYNTFNSGLSSNIIRTFYRDSDGLLWIGTQNGLNRMDSDGTFTGYNLKGNYKPETANNLILDIKPLRDDCDSLLLIGTETGLATFNRKTGRHTLLNRRNSSLSDEVIKCIYTTDESIWLGTNFGLNVIDRATGTIRTYFHEALARHTLSNNVIWRIFHDRSGTLWLLTDNGANYTNEVINKFRFHRVSYRHGERMIGKQLRSMDIDNRGTIYSATDNGLLVWDTASDKEITSPDFNNYLLMPNVGCVVEDPHGRLWIGSTGGINIFSPGMRAVRSFSTQNVSQFNSNYVARIRIHPSGNIFFVSVWDSGIYRIILDEAGLPDRFNNITKVSTYPTETLVVDSDFLWYKKNNRIYRIDVVNGHETECTALNAALDGKRVESLYLHHDGNLYTGTHDGVLIYDIQTTSSRFIPLNSLRGGSVVNLIADHSGTVWGSTENTIFSVDRNGHVTSEELDGNFPLRKIHPDCMAVGPDGKIYCGGDDGFVSFDPHDLTVKHYTSPVYITSLSVNNHRVDIGEPVNGRVILERDICHTDNIKLGYNQRNVTLEFASLDHGAYIYLLEGLDREWVSAERGQNTAVYSNLSPGKYQFRVRVGSNDGQWFDEAALSIRVLPPFMFRWPFIILYILAGLFLSVWIFRLSTRRLRLMNELRITRLEKEHGEKIMESRAQFFTNISHEFRTPLTLITSPIREALLTTENEDVKRLLGIAGENSDKMLRLVNQLLDFRKTDAGLTVDMSLCDLTGIAQRCYGMFSDIAHRNDITYHLSAPPLPVNIICDEEKTEAIIYNLLSNAFKFTPSGGEISLNIATETDPETVIIRVTDNGPGIDVNEQEKIFEDFYRSDKTAQQTLGSGLGLSIVKKYAEIQGGRVEVSTRPGHGSIFTVILSAGGNLGNNTAGKTPATSGFVDNYVESQTVNEADERPLILYVEDNESMVEFISISLAKKYRVVAANNGAEGYTRAVNLLPHVIVSDVMMPDTDGITMSRMLKENPRTRHIPIIILTAKSLARDQVEGLKAGVDKYLVKPVYPEVLDASIEQVIRRRRQMEDYFREELMVVADTGSGKKGDLDKKLIDDIISLIESNISDPDFGVESISKVIGISSAHLYRRIKKLTGLSTNELIRKYRLKKASIMIKGNRGSISEIMYHVGFTSPSYFSKCFRAEFGMIPTEYKERHFKSTDAL